MVLNAGNTGLRSRKIENDKVLPVFKCDELQLALLGTQLIQRATPQVATGVEKEEEGEKHLQAALMTGNTSHDDVKAFIPTPDASTQFKDYDKYYFKTFVEPRVLIRFSGKIEDAIGCPFNIDKDGIEFVKQHYKSWNRSLSDSENIVEYVILALENFGNTIKDDTVVPTLSEALEDMEKTSLDIYDKYINEIPSIFEYWKKRRFKSGKSVRIYPMLRIPSDNTPLESTDPFVCFRKREVKPYKKTRRANVISREYLENVESLIATSKSLLDMFLQRALARKNLLEVECQILEHIILLIKNSSPSKAPAHDLVAIYAGMLDRNLHSSDTENKDHPHSTAKKLKDHPFHLGTLVDDFQMQRKKPRSALYWRQSPSNLLFKDVLNSNFISNESIAGLFVRRRIGRGGRMHIDRRITFHRKPKSIFPSTNHCRNYDNPFSYSFGPSDDDIQPFDDFHAHDTSYLIAHSVLSHLLGENELRNVSLSNRKDLQNNQMDRKRKTSQDDIQQVS